MTQPAIGEPITARYPGVCTRSGQPIAPGAQIVRDEHGYYLVGTPDPGGDIRLGGGSGYGYDGWTVGDVCWDKDQVVVVTRAGSDYYREDGLSFGVGDDRGRYYWALARPATDEEAAPLLVRREAARLAREKAEAQKSGLAALFDWRTGAPNTPEGRSLIVQGRRLKIGEGFSIYGTGEELVIDADGQHVWRLMNNGMDGDDWSLNNVRTGGAGAIGVRFPLTDERRAFLAEHWPETETAEVSDDDEDDRL